MLRAGRDGAESKREASAAKQSKASLCMRSITKLLFLSVIEAPMSGRDVYHVTAARPMGGGRITISSVYCA